VSVTPYHRLPDPLAAHHYGRAAALAAWHLDGQRDVDLELRLGELYAALSAKERAWERANGSVGRRV
jgi:hypothetical protein